MADKLSNPVIDWAGGTLPQSSGGVAIVAQSFNASHAIGYPVYTVPLINNVGFLTLAPTAATTQAFPIG